MSNFGVFDLRVVRPYDLAFREARSAVGAAAVLESAKLHSTVAEAVAECRVVVGTSARLTRDAHHASPRLEAAGLRMQEELERGDVALLFGSEKFGLSNEDLSHCDCLLHIPTREQHFSMNLGQAVAVCLYELIRKEGELPTQRSRDLPERDTATAADRERLVASLMENLHDSGYLAKHQQADMDAEIRRMVSRLDLCASDAYTLLGMLRQMLWKMRSNQ